MGKIEMDFARAKNQANQLENIANDLKRLANNNMDSTINSISANWQCQSSNEFCRKGRVVKNDIYNSAIQLQNIANSIRVIAARTYEAEKRIQEIAEARNYNN